MDLRVPNDEWAELTKLLKAFADSHALSFRDASLSRPGVVKTLELRLCAPDQPTIEIVEQRWANNEYLPRIPDRGVGIRLYGDVPEVVWQPMAIQIVSMLERRWPNEVRFLNGGGYWIDRPAFLGAHTTEAPQ
jgi:hypothetical protein